MSGLHTELIVLTVFKPWNEQFPHAARNQLPHLVASAVPVIEVAHHTHILSIGSPDREIDALHAVDLAQLCAKLFIAMNVRAFAHQMQIVVGQQGREGIGVIDRDDFSSVTCHLNPVPLGFADDLRLANSLEYT